MTYGQDKPVTVQNQLSALTQLRGLLPMCLSNTGGILWHEAGDEAVRAGIAMYGVSPDGNISSASLGIDPVMTLESEIIAFQDLQPARPAVTAPSLLRIGRQDWLSLPADMQTVIPVKTTRTERSW